MVLLVGWSFALYAMVLVCAVDGATAVCRKKSIGLKGISGCRTPRQYVPSTRIVNE